MRTAWRMLIAVLLMCFLLPLIALRGYAPLNSIVANFGLVWAAVWLICPPALARRRRARYSLIFLWPLVLVVLPLYVVTLPPRWPRTSSSPVTVEHLSGTGSRLTRPRLR